MAETLTETDWQPIKRIRIKLGFTQYELARDLGVAQPTVSQWEAGTRPIGRATQARIWEKYGRLAEDLGITEADLEWS